RWGREKRQRDSGENRQRGSKARQSRAAPPVERGRASPAGDARRCGWSGNSRRPGEPPSCHPAACSPAPPPLSPFLTIQLSGHAPLAASCLALEEQRLARHRRHGCRLEWLGDEERRLRPPAGEEALGVGGEEE